MSLNGKKIIFIGDSFIYYGNAVLRKTWEYYRECERVHDTGYFYQLCSANGEDVSVTNWTFGGHGLATILSESCHLDYACKGVNHMQQLEDRCYDYVIMSGGRSSDISEERFLGAVKAFMGLFREANPNVRFVYLVSSGAHNISVKRTFPVNVLNNLKTIEKWGVTIVDWGKLVADIIRGNVSVPNTRHTYKKTTFTVSRKETDGFHPNPLAGYITALMTYSAITGKSAVGQPYGFCTDGNISERFDTDFYLKEYYTYGEKTTNYPEIFDSSSDMNGIQQLIDRYLEAKHYREYNYSPLS